MPVELLCTVCKKTYCVPPSRAKQNPVACSLKCYSKLRTGNNNPNWKGGLVERICLWCKKEFKVKPKEIKAGGGKCCSRSCSSKRTGSIKAEKSKLKMRVSYCKECNKKILTKPSRPLNSGTYCSRKCMAKGYEVSLRGESNPNWRHGIEPSTIRQKRVRGKGSYRKSDIVKTYHRQRGECAICSESISDGYDIDHIIPVSRNGVNTVGNIQLLCPHCNRTKHSKLPIQYKAELIAVCVNNEINKVIKYFDGRDIQKYMVNNLAMLVTSDAVMAGVDRNSPNFMLDYPSGIYHGLRIELKRQKGSYPTPEQKEWLERLNNAGFMAVVCKGWVEAKEVIEAYLG